MFLRAMSLDKNVTSTFRRLECALRRPALVEREARNSGVHAELPLRAIRQTLRAGSRTARLISI